MPATSLPAPLPACLSPAETRSTGCPGAAERRGGLATVQAELTKLRPFCLERELESPWRLRWEGRRQLQLPKKKKIGQNFPSSRQRSKPAACPAEGPRAPALPSFLAGDPRGGTWNPAGAQRTSQRGPEAEMVRAPVPVSAPRPEHSARSHLCGLQPQPGKC